ncbi:unnamed protein product [Prunus brigantina]
MTAKYKAYIVQKLGLQRERAVGRLEEISTNQNYVANEDLVGHRPHVQMIQNVVERRVITTRGHTLPAPMHLCLLVSPPYNL